MCGPQNETKRDKTNVQQSSSIRLGLHFSDNANSQAKVPIQLNSQHSQ